MNEIIIVKPEKCVGCNACVRCCPAAEANITRQLDDGRFITAVNPDKCIECKMPINIPFFTFKCGHQFHNLCLGVNTSNDTSQCRKCKDLKNKITEDKCFGSIKKYKFFAF